MDAGTDVQTESDADAQPLPDHCDVVEVSGKVDAQNRGLDLNRQTKPPDECDLIRNCTDEMRLVHWCATECPASHDCQPGGSWRAVEYRGGYTVAFVCDTGYRCPAD
jgi:hypothetical protein